MSLMDIFKKEDGKTLILMAEDSPTQALQLEFLLEENNFAVAVARNGAEAIKILEKRRPAMVISDVVMPEVDGFGLCLHIKTNENLKDIPVILMTSLSDANEAVKGLYCGADVLFAKPYDEALLISRVKNILANMEMKALEQQPAVAEDRGPKGIHVSIGGRKHFVTNERLQTIDLLLSAYEIAMHKNQNCNKLRNVSNS
jgi:DNA-binding response OmpR family regulator